MKPEPKIRKVRVRPGRVAAESDGVSRHNQPLTAIAMKTVHVLCGKCPRCAQFADNVARAADALGIEYQLIRASDVEQIIKFGVMVLPALVVDGQVKVSGRVPSQNEIMKMLA
jgi:small redox-active disulfide protein 2